MAMWASNVVGGIGILVIGLIIRLAKASSLIAYNTMQAREAKYDEEALTRFVGNMLIVAAVLLLLPLVAVPCRCDAGLGGPCFLGAVRGSHHRRNGLCEHGESFPEEKREDRDALWQGVRPSSSWRVVSERFQQDRMEARRDHISLLNSWHYDDRSKDSSLAGRPSPPLKRTSGCSREAMRLSSQWMTIPAPLLDSSRPSPIAFCLPISLSWRCCQDTRAAGSEASWCVACSPGSKACTWWIFSAISSWCRSTRGLACVARQAPCCGSMSTRPGLEVPIRAHQPP